LVGRRCCDGITASVVGSGADGESMLNLGTFWNL
jgi:hypothetical protein